MGIVFRQSVKTTIVTFSGALLGALIIYISTKFLPKQEFGISRNITNQAVVSSQFLLLGLHSALYIFIHKYPPGDARRRVLISICMIGPLIFSLICIIPYVLLEQFIIGKYQLEDQKYLQPFFLWMPLLTLLWSYLMMLEYYLSSQMKVALSIFFREVLLRLFNIVFIVLFALGHINFPQFVIGSILIHIIPVGCLFYLSTQTDDFGLSFNWKAFSPAEYREIIHFSWYHILLGSSITLLGYIDSLMLAPLDKKGMSSLAVYTVAGFIMSVIQIPYKSMASATTPLLTRAYEANDRKMLSDMFDRSAINLLIVSLAMTALIVCNMHNAVAILPEGYEATGTLVLIFLFGRIADMATGLNTEILSITKYYKYNFYTTAFLLVTIVILNRIMIPLWGIYGAAWGTSISMVLFNGIKYFFVWRKLGIQPFSKKTLLIFLSCAIAIAPGYFLPHIHQPIIDTIIRSIVIAVVYVCMLLWLKPSEDLRSYLATVKENKRLF